MMLRTLLIIVHGDLASGDLTGLSSIMFVVVAGLLALTAGILLLAREKL
ncbi:MAG: hypothetical protein QW579_02675 [Desulfurococcaceae archaeon]